MVLQEPAARLQVGLLAVPSALPSLRWAQIEQLQLPAFRVGTLDSLLALSETLARYDGTATQLALRIAQECPSTPSFPSKLSLTVDFHQYQPFQWNHAKYGQPDLASLPQLSHQVWRHVEDLEKSFRLRQEEYSQAKQHWQSLEQCFSGGLTFRPLSSLVRKDQVLQTEHLCTVFLLVSVREQDSFTRSYETLSTAVVPRSAKLVAQDDEHGLYSIVVFRKGLDEFLRAARECRYQIREYRTEAEAEQLSLEERLVKARMHWQQTSTSFGAWSVDAYMDCMDALVHMKLMRLFVEGVLRYGLPVSFAAAWVVFEKQQESKVRKELVETFRTLYDAHHRSHPRFSGGQVELPPIPGLSSADMELASEDEPFVWFTMDATFRR
jgi:V-type H+-transporting ATPase subunit C